MQQCSEGMMQWMKGSTGRASRDTVSRHRHGSRRWRDRALEYLRSRRRGHGQHHNPQQSFVQCARRDREDMNHVLFVGGGPGRGLGRGYDGFGRWFRRGVGRFVGAEERVPEGRGCGRRRRRRSAQGRDIVVVVVIVEESAGTCVSCVSRRNERE